MKKLLTLLFAFAFLFGMTACGGSATQEEDTEEATEMIETSADEAMESDDMEIEADTAAVEMEMDTTAVE